MAETERKSYRIWVVSTVEKREKRGRGGGTFVLAGMKEKGWGSLPALKRKESKKKNGRFSSLFSSKRPSSSPSRQKEKEKEREGPLYSCL